MGGDWRKFLSAGLVAAVIVACGGDDDQDDTAATTTAPETTAPATTTTAPPTTTTTAPATTTTTTSTTTTTTAATTTTTEPAAPACDETPVLEAASARIALARLAPGGTWVVDDDPVAFDERTNDAEEFRDRLALDCSLRAVQRTDAGDERLLIAAWTGERRGYVV